MLKRVAQVLMALGVGGLVLSFKSLDSDLGMAGVFVACGAVLLVLGAVLSFVVWRKTMKSDQVEAKSD